MGKLFKFEHMQSKWEGLWYHPDTHMYTSTVINLADLKQFKGSVRIVMIKNRYFTKGSSRPSYVFKIMDADSADAKMIELEDIEDYENDD